MVKIGLVGPSYQQRSLPWDAQRTINLIPMADEMGKEVTSLIGTPGLTLFATAGSGPIRGAFESSNGRAFFVSGNTLFEISSLGIATSRGTLNSNSGQVSMAEGLTQMVICDGADGYYFTYSTNTLAQITDADFPSTAGFMTNVSGYFIATEEDTGRFYISTLNDASAWDALDFATAESSPDLLVAAVNALGLLWLLGDKTIEPWQITSSGAFPFSSVGSGAVINYGLLARHSVLEIDNTIVWLGKDKYGKAIVYRADGFTPARISTTPIELKLQELDDYSNVVAWGYQMDGHLYYILTGGELETSLAYDFTTGLWHERAYLNSDGELEQHLGICHVFAFNKHLVGDRRNGRVYDMDMETYTDAGDYISRERIFTHLSDEGRRIRYNELEIGFEAGVGLTTGQGSDPLASLRLSRDGARTWSDWQYASMGKIGEYQTSVKFRRLGVTPQMTFHTKVTDPVKVAITGAYLR